MEKSRKGQLAFHSHFLPGGVYQQEAETLCLERWPHLEAWKTANLLGFLGGSDSKRICLQCRRPRFKPWVRKIPLQYSCLQNSMNRRAWRAAVHGVVKSLIRLSDQHFHFLVLVGTGGLMGGRERQRREFVTQPLFPKRQLLISKTT